jgi:hypothetical protein
MNYSFAPHSNAFVQLGHMPEQEKYLSQFILDSLQQTCTNQYSPDIALQILDRAWQAQKLLWQLRAARMLG